MDESRRRRVIALLIAGHQNFRIAFRVHSGAAAHSIITGIARAFRQRFVRILTEIIRRKAPESYGSVIRFSGQVRHAICGGTVTFPRPLAKTLSTTDAVLLWEIVRGYWLPEFTSNNTY
jgi:hypothetical protein